MIKRLIQPKEIWTNTGQKEVKYLSLTNFTDYHFNNKGGIVYYSLFGLESPGSVVNATGQLETLAHLPMELYKGTISIPAEIVNQWGTDDNIIWDYVARTLNLTLINN